MKKLYFTLLFFASLTTFAQRFTLVGTVVDSSAKPLQYATIMLLNMKDSSLANYGRTDYKGNFELKNIAEANYLFKITFMGHKPYWKPIIPAGSTLLDMGTVKMEAQSKILDEIVVKAEAAPVKIIGDTVVFNAGSFKVKQNAVVEDLLKKLPGVEVDREGNIKAQGENVRRITVDGKEFFGRDPKMASKNLPADAIDKVKLYDKRSDQADFTGIDDGRREKNIDLTLKEDRKKGIFGNIMAGAGLDERFQSRLNLNRFNKAKQFSVLGMGNNINQQGFSIQDYMNFTGELNRMMSGGSRSFRFEINSDDGSIPLNFGGRPNGFMRNWAGGMNFNNPLSKKSELNGSYFYNNLNQLTEREINRQNFFANQNFNSKSNSLQENTNENHRLNFTLDQKIDSMNSILMRTYLTYNKTNSNTASSSQSVSDKGVLLNDGTRNNLRFGEGLGLNSNLLYRHKFAKKGRTFSSDFSFSVNNSNSNGTLKAINRYYKSDSVFRRDDIQQLNNSISNRMNYGVNSSYTEPLGKRKYLELNYSLQKSQYDSKSDVFDTNNGEKILNKLLTNEFESDYTYNRLGGNFRYNQKKYNFSTGVHYQLSHLEGKMLLLNDKISRNFSNFLPNLHFNYDFQQSEHLRLDYETTFQEPNITQLAPIIDNRDPLNIYVGNPNLKPEYSHRINLGYNMFNQLAFSSLFANLSLVYATNKISNSTNISELLVRTSKPINVKDDYLLNGSISYGFRIKPIKTRFEIGESLFMNRGINFVNDVENRTQTKQATTTFRISYQQDKFDASADARIGYNTTNYSVNTAMNQKYFTNNYSADLNWTIVKDLILSSDFDYLVYAGRTDGFNRKIPIWSASVSTFFLKNRRGELKFGVTDILNQNKGITRTAQLNFVQDELIKNLGRFYMVSFTYSLKGFNPNGGPNIKILR